MHDICIEAAAVSAAELPDCLARAGGATAWDDQCWTAAMGSGTHALGLAECPVDSQLSSVLLWVLSLSTAWAQRDPLMTPQKALNELPEGYRIIVTLYLIEGYDHEEIAEILGISSATSRSQYNRGKKKLRDLLNEMT